MMRNYIEQYLRGSGCRGLIRGRSMLHVFVLCMRKIIYVHIPSAPCLSPCKQFKAAGYTRNHTILNHSIPNSPKAGIHMHFCPWLYTDPFNHSRTHAPALGGGGLWGATLVRRPGTLGWRVRCPARSGNRVLYRPLSLYSRSR